MKIRMKRVLPLLLACALCSLFVPTHTGRAQGAAFTYQGHMLDNGTNFTGPGQFKFALITSTYTNRQATATATLSGPFVTSYTVTSGGSGYLTPPPVTISGGGGSGATATASVGGGVVRAINPVMAGSGYATPPMVTVGLPPGSAVYTTYWSNDGTSTGGSEPAAAVSLEVRNGLFTVAIGDTTLPNMQSLAAAVFDQPDLQLRIWFNDGVNGSVALNPPQRLTPSPYAFRVTPVSVALPPGMALIPAGAFTMGDTLDGLADATSISVTVSAFYMDVHEVSLSQWQSVYFWAKDHGYVFAHVGVGKAANHPVLTVDWYDCVKWCNARSEQAGKPPVYYTDAGLTQVYTNGEPTTIYPNWVAKGYRLPTEAEWEKAARGGLSAQRFPWGNVVNQNLANYFGVIGPFDLGPNGINAIGSVGGTAPATSPVGSFAANGYGLCDMVGNAFEWCWDWYGTPLAGGTDPHGPAVPLSDRVLRGGAWSNGAYDMRCAFRLYFSPTYSHSDVGFRCVRGL